MTQLLSIIASEREDRRIGEAHRKLCRVRKVHHHRLINAGTFLLVVSAVLFALEMLASGGVTGVLGAVLTGLADTPEEI
jgi:hypothetical protein